MYWKPIALGGGPGQRCPRGATRPVFFGARGILKPSRSSRDEVISMFALAAVLVAVTVLAVSFQVPAEREAVKAQARRRQP
jgi:hypothetical protein